uniref:Uncharacterized protein n=1 Tax=Tanacetum cinerariifolium TaxID=118510 RepID=A0A699I5N8_TANCI|nr:hypothetical protein [Tanacetum cinerariifolium]
MIHREDVAWNVYEEAIVKSGQMYALEISPGEGVYDLDLFGSQEEEFANKNQELFERNKGKHLLHMLYDTDSIWDVRWSWALSGYPLWEPLNGILWSQSYEGKKMCLRGTRHSELQRMSGKKFHKKSLPFMSCVWHVATSNLMQTGEAPSHGSQTELQLRLQEFEDVFAIPYALPPQRSFDHKIILRDESTMVNIKPYRYPPNQKDVIEAMVNELMETDVARQSYSLYYSPIVLVKKKDET